jgi:hypothetical protein
VLRARENALLQLLAVPGAGLNEVIPFLISFLEEPREVQRDLSSSPSFDPCRGPGCVLSTLLLVAMTLHLVGLDCSTDLDDDGEGDGGEYGEPIGEQLTGLPMLVGAILEYVVWRAPFPELTTLKQHGVARTALAGT